MEIPVKSFFPMAAASLCIIGLGAQVSSGMILPFEQFPDATADYKSTATPPVDTLFLTPDEATGLPLSNLKEKKIHSPSGKLMLLLSPNEHAWFRDGKLARYLYVASKDRKQRAGISSPEDMPLIIPNVNAGIIYDVDLFASKNLQDRFIDKIDGRPCIIRYDNSYYHIIFDKN
jgi:hypothetical protein